MSDTFRIRIVNIRSRHHNRAYEDAESSGLFHFKHDLLEQLPVYLSHIKKMKKDDPNAYALYANVGGILLPPNAMLRASLSDVDVSRIPSFVCAMLGSGIDQEKEFADTIWPRLLYLQKMKAIPGVQLSSGDIYAMTMFYTRNNQNDGVPVRYHVAVLPDGNVRLLRELRSSKIRIQSKRGKHDSRHYDIPVRKWQVPQIMKKLAIENGYDVDEQAKRVFSFLAGIAPRMQIGVQVRAYKDGPRAVFNVEIGRTPYFFKDREPLATGSGKTKKIFHFVPGFNRLDGTPVRGHTKGLRKFDWNGYHIHVGIPGMDFPSISTFTKPGKHIDEGSPVPHDMIEDSAAAKELADVIESSAWWMNRKNKR